MSLVKSTNYAPDLFKALNGILLVYKPPKFTSKELVQELRGRITDSLNQYKPRPITKRVVIQGGADAEKSIVEMPNLSDHPLVVGPRYLPWEISMSLIRPNLKYRSSGLELILVGDANKYFGRKMRHNNFVNVYHVTGRFGHVTDTFFYDGKITDRSTFGHITAKKIDSILARIEASQRDRLFDSSAVPLDSQEAYELAKAWPSRPPKMAEWPVIYRIRCIHFQLPIFKLEIMICNENESLLAQIPHDVAQMLKSSAFTESIRRVKFGPFDVNDSLTDKDWNLQSIISSFKVYQENPKRMHEIINHHINSIIIRPELNEKSCSEC